MTARFHPVEGVAGVHVARRGKLSCMALRLRDGGVCLYSPVAGLEPGLAGQADRIGTVAALLAPNHYHNKGLKSHIEACPAAGLYCSDTAQPRLSRITGLAFSPLPDLEPALPEEVSLHVPPGLKTGEVWVGVTSGADRALIVADAFGAAFPPPGEWAASPTMSTSFPRYGVKDPVAYRTWATRLLETAKPTILLPCHGAPVRSADLADRLVDLLNSRF